VFFHDESPRTCFKPSCGFSGIRSDAAVSRCKCVAGFFNSATCASLVLSAASAAHASAYDSCVVWHDASSCYRGITHGH